MRTYSLKKQNSSINKDKRRNCIFANFANVLVLFSAVATAASGIVVFCKRGLPWLRCTKTLFATIFLIKKVFFAADIIAARCFFSTCCRGANGVLSVALRQRALRQAVSLCFASAVGLAFADNFCRGFAENLQEHLTFIYFCATM